MMLVIKKYMTRVISNEWVSSRYKHLIVYAPEAVTLCKPGQFFHLRCSDELIPLLRRPMSIYQIRPEKGEIHFLYLVKGAGTTLMSGMRQGDGLEIFGPLGQGFSLQNEWKNILLLARGVGLATLGPLTEMATAQGIKAHAVLSARTREDLLSVDYMKDSGADVYTVTEEDGNSDVEQVRGLVCRLIDAKKIDAVFTCGSKRLTAMLREVALERGLPGQVALEENMGCGIGMCFCCVKPFMRNGQIANLRVCCDGPVFPLEEVLEG
jgi:dihydroorotate dehydrogenase electron transfer subunit